MDGLTSEWLGGLAGYDCVFMELIPGEKRTKRSWAFYEKLHKRNGGPCLGRAYQWLNQGSGLGILLRGGLWVLDVDSCPQMERVVSTLLDARVMPPYVRTPSGMAHYYFRLPAEFQLLGKVKNHLCHPMDPDGVKQKMDFKLGPRTLLVAPGTMRKGTLYTPGTPWREPPVLDPRFFLPSGAFWMPPNRPFAVDDRPLKNRIARACYYLRFMAPVSVAQDGGRKALVTVTAHLVAFLQLDPALAYHLLTHGYPPWNSRCRFKDGSPYPWSQEELWRACCDAVDSVPQGGLKLFQRNRAREQRDRALSTFMDILKQAQTSPSSGSARVWVQDLHSRFQNWSQKLITDTAFGIALRKHGFNRVKFTKAKLAAVEGIDLIMLDSLLAAATAA